MTIRSVLWNRMKLKSKKTDRIWKSNPVRKRIATTRSLCRVSKCQPLPSHGLVDQQPSSSILTGGRFIWRGPKSGESLDTFLQNNRPTQLSTRDCEWIQIRNENPASPGYKDDSSLAPGLYMNNAPYHAALSKLEGIIAVNGRVKSSDKQACVQEILQTAVSRGETDGKWMLFMNRENVDDAWDKIARATAAGKLGSSAKVAPSKDMDDKGRALICIYVSDFSDKKEVKRVLNGIIALQFFVASGFKPDIFTTLEINSGNKWRLDPVIYKPKDVLDNWDV